ncbi:cytochrome b5 reductase 4-like isoform X2 [Oscarella lobularis]|uniref:cytochrome b5 reductase 4-like isoform X2 n=1 Tax=Oscarella lobularis TaxID=121494 RepID=UPI0033130BF2
MAQSSRMGQSSLMPPPPPPSSSSSSSSGLLSPATSISSNATGSGRTKVALKPGHSLMDWIRLGKSSGTDLTGVGGPGHFGQVTEAELAKHQRENDVWIAIRGRVYNITRYLDFHPGGVPEIMRGAGRDGTNLFTEIHKWVNVESMLATCYVGPLVIDTERKRKSPGGHTQQLTVPSLVVSSIPSSNVPKKVQQVAANSADAAESDVGQKSWKRLRTFFRSFGAMRRKSFPGTERDDKKRCKDTVPATLDSGMGQRLSPPSSSSSQRRSTFPTITTSSPPDENRPTKPSYTWDQTDDDVTLKIATDYGSLSIDDVLLEVRTNVVTCAAAGEEEEKQSTVITCVLFLGKMVYELSGELCDGVSNTKISIDDKKAAHIVLTKTKSGKEWTALHNGAAAAAAAPLDEHFGKRRSRLPKYRTCTVRDIEVATHDVKLFHVELPPLCHMVVPTGHHVYLRCNIEGVEVTRPYTPVAEMDGDCGYINGRSFLLLVKIYSQGTMTQYLNTLQKGSQLDVSDPDGTFSESVLDGALSLCLVGAGTGFTPMAKLIRRFFEGNNDPLRSVKLICANKTTGDRLWRDRLERMEASVRGRLQVKDILSAAASDEWSGLRGRVSKDLLEEFFPPPTADGIFICFCGNMPFNAMMRRHMKQLGYSESQYHLFN